MRGFGEKKMWILHTVLAITIMIGLVFVSGCAGIFQLFQGNQQEKGPCPNTLDILKCMGSTCICCSNITDVLNCTGSTCICKPVFMYGQDYSKSFDSHGERTPDSLVPFTAGELEISHHFLCDPGRPGLNKLEVEGSTSIPFTINRQDSPPSIKGEEKIKYTASGQNAAGTKYECNMKSCSGISELTIIGYWEYKTASGENECHFQISEKTQPSDCKNICLWAGTTQPYTPSMSAGKIAIALPCIDGGVKEVKVDQTVDCGWITKYTLHFK